MADTEEKTKRPRSGENDTVDHFLEGFSQAFREFMRDRKMWEILLGALTTLIGVKIVASNIRKVLHDDPKLRELEAAQREELIELISEHLDHFFDRGKDGLLTLKKGFVEHVLPQLKKLVEKCKDGFELWKGSRQADRTRGDELLRASADRVAATKHFSGLADLFRPKPVTDGSPPVPPTHSEGR